jgi:hypothetical protein
VILTHTLSKPVLDHQAGGWVVVCSCGWKHRPTYYKERAKKLAEKHLEGFSK